MENKRALRLCRIDHSFLHPLNGNIMTELAKPGLVGLPMSVVCGSCLTTPEQKVKDNAYGFCFCCGESGCLCMVLKGKCSNFQSLPCVVC